MKRLIAFVCLISVCLTLCSCDPAGHLAGDWLEPERISSVELIQYDNDVEESFALQNFHIVTNCNLRNSQLVSHIGNTNKSILVQLVEYIFVAFCNT